MTRIITKITSNSGIPNPNILYSSPRRKTVIC
jgi:hypothetical protein